MQQLTCGQEFSKSVEEFVNRVKDPKKFISELTELIYYLHQLVKDDSTIERNDDPSFHLSLVVSHIAAPLVQGGPDVIENIKNGVIELADFSDARDFDKGLRLVLMAISTYSDACLLDRNDFEAFLILCDLSACISIYIYMKSNQKEKLRKKNSNHF